MSVEADDKMINRIRKLLNLSQDGGASKGEVDNAMRMAQELMAKYNLEEADVILNEDEATKLAGIDEYEIRTLKQWPSWLQGIVIATQKLCSVSGIFYTGYDGKKTLKFVGYAADVVVAQEMLKYLDMSCRMLAKIEIGPRWCKDHHQYAIGFADEINRRVIEMLEEQAERMAEEAGKAGAIVLAKKDNVKSWVEQNRNVKNKPVRQGGSGDDFARGLGRKAGRRVDLSTNKKIN